MPRVSVVMVRTALVWWGIGFTLGGLVLFNKGMPFLGAIWSLRSSHIFILLIGWLVQLSAGVAIWIMPRLIHPGVVTGSGDRGDLRLVRLCYLALNVGVILAASYPPLIWLSGGEAVSLRWMPPLAGVLWLTAILAFVANVWQRVRPVVELAGAAPQKKETAS
jgi:hypothetical protein